MKTLAAIILAALAAWTSPGAAQTYPDHAIRLIVPFAPGQVTDWLGRFLAEKMTDKLGQPVVVENRAGASGVVGTQYAAHAPPDGYTLVISSNGTNAAAPVFYKDLPYDPVTSFEHIHGLMALPWALSVVPGFPASNMQEFIAYAKRHPGKLTGGYGSNSSRYCIYLLRTMAGIDIADIPYKSLGQTITDTIGGRLDFTFLDMGSAAAQANGKALKLLGITSLQRSPAEKNLPTVAETLPGYEMTSWLGLAAPAGTPAAITGRLTKVVDEILADPANAARIRQYGGDVLAEGPEALLKRLRAENQAWRKFAQESGIHPE